jgi:hypothetical protein
MEPLKPRIEFYRQRSFSEKLNVVFEFIRENWKPLLKYSFYLIMPVCLIQTFAMNSFFSSYLNVIMNISPGTSPFGNSMVSFLGNYGVLVFCIFFGTAILTGMIYALMQTYAVRENRLKDVTLDDFKDLLVKNAWKYLLLMFALIFVFILIAFLMGFLAAVTSPISLFITIPIFIVGLIFLIPLMLVVPTYIFERDITLPEAFQKAWKLGYTTISGMLGLMIVLYIISSVIQTVTMLPWYLMIMVGTVFSLTSESMMSQSVIYKFLLYIFGLIQSYGMYVASIIGIIGLAFQYFHAREKIEGVTIESNISNFYNL